MVRNARCRARRREHDGGTWLADRTHRDPAHRSIGNVVAHLEAKNIAIKRQRRLWITVGKKTGVNRYIYTGNLIRVKEIAA
jgi:hypothetical protein